MRTSRLRKAIGAAIVTAIAAAFGSSAAAQCPPNSFGPCCTAHGGVGCNDTTCCDAVCFLDSFCCAVGWDGICAGIAQTECDPGACNPPLPGCGTAGTGDCCTANGSPNCEDFACCVAVCNIDPSCCTVEWDQDCADEAAITCAACAPPLSCGDPLAGDCLLPNGTTHCDCAPCCELICAGDPFCCNTLWDSICADDAIANCTGPVLTLVADDTCVNGADVLTVTVELTNLKCDAAAGFQAFLAFDDSALTFTGGSYTAVPFGLAVLDPIVAVGGEIDLAAGIDLIIGQMPFSGSATLATLTFEANSDECVGDTISFRPAFPPTRLTYLGGGEIPGLVTVDSAPVVVDTTDPFWTFQPGDIKVPADAGFCSALVAIAPATADDNCGIVTVTGVRDDGDDLTDPYPVGTTEITWTATDPCGNSISFVRNVEVQPFSELVLTVALDGMMAPGSFTRCIDIELFGCPAGVPLSVDVTFIGGVGTAIVPVPCTAMAYDCATARDPLHTLRSTTGVSVVGTVFVADFVSASALLGGNADGNEFIDILDFGVFAAQWNAFLGADTPCPTSGPHADFNGDGFVTLLDFSFIQMNFLEFDQPGCTCPLPLMADGVRKAPIERISVRELRRMGRADLIVADFNGDGWLDAEDIVHFMLYVAQ